MSSLLDRVHEVFVAPSPLARVLVLGYYSMFSVASRFPYIATLIEVLIHETFNPPQLQALELRAFSNPVNEAEARLILNGRTFRDASRADLQAAVARANAKVPSGRYQFVDPAFADVEAAFAPKSLIWGLDRDGKAEDSLALDRQHFCAEVESTPGPVRFACNRASVGHPNVQGSQRYAHPSWRRWPPIRLGVRRRSPSGIGHLHDLTRVSFRMADPPLFAKQSLHRVSTCDHPPRWRCSVRQGRSQGFACSRRNVEYRSFAPVLEFKRARVDNRRIANQFRQRTNIVTVECRYQPVSFRLGYVSRT
jgi:hypothetical protein